MASGYTLPTSKNIWEFDPTSIPGCTLWMDGADTNTLFTDYAGTTPATVGGSVLRWVDKASLRLPALTNNIATTSFNGVYGLNAPVVSTDSASGKTALSFGVGTVIATGAIGGTTTITCTSSITLQQRQPIVFTSNIASLTTPYTLYYVLNPIGSPTTSFQITLNPNTASVVPTGNASGSNVTAIIGSASMLLPFGSFSVTATSGSTSFALNISAPTNSVTFAPGQTIYTNPGFGGLVQNVIYYIVSVSNTNPTTSFTLSTVPGGTPFQATATASGTMILGTDTSTVGVPTFPTLKNETTSFVVAKYASPVGGAPSGIFGYGASTTGAGRFISYRSSTTGEVSNIPASATLSITGLTSGATNIISTTQSGNFISAWRTGTAVTPLDLSTSVGNFSTGTTAAVVGSRIGDYFMYGQIMEILHFNVALSAADRQTIEGYLAWKWGLQANLPSGHTYTPSVTRPLSRQFVPTDLDNCQVWLDPSDSSTIGYGNLMSQWNDKSGNNRVAYSLGGPRSVSNYIDVSAGGFVTSPFQLATAGACSIFICLNQYAASTINSYYFGDANANTPNGFVIYRTNGNLVGYLLNGNNNVSSYATTGMNDVYSLQTTGSVATAFINGTSTLSTTIGSIASLSSANSTYRICFSSTISGVTAYVCEILAYNKSVSTTERRDIEGYLAWKWGNQASLPAGHPYLSAAPVGFVPNTSVSGCQLWLDGNDSSTIITAPVVTRLTEKTTNTVSTITGLPRYISGTYPAIRLTGADFFNFGTSLLNIGLEPFTFFAALKSSSQISTSVIPIIGRNTAAPLWWAGYNAQNIQSQYSVGAATLIVLSGAPSTLNVLPHNLTVDYVRTNLAGATTGTLYQNGQNLVSTSATLATSAGAFPLYLGFGASSLFMQGDIYEVIVYVGSGTTSPLTTLQRQQVEGYLAWKWGTQALLPISHPYYSSAPVGFVPNTSVSGCGFWIDASDATTLQTSTNTVVSIADKSGQGNTFTNPLSSIVYNPTLNGLLTLTGTSGSSTNTLLSPRITRDGYNHSYFAIYKYPTLTATTNATILSSPSDGAGLFQLFASGSAVTLRDVFSVAGVGVIGGASTLVLGSGVDGNQFTNNNTFLIVGVRQNAYFTVTCNGSTLNASTNNTNYVTGAQNPPSVQFTLGLPSIGGQLAEVILYNSALTVNQRQMVEGYLMWKWGIRRGTVPIPSNYPMPRNHPYYGYPPPALTGTTPLIDTYKTSFDPADLQPAIWLDPADTSTISTDTNGRIMTILNKGTIARVNPTITLVANNTDLTVSSTTYLTVGTLIMIFDPIPGSPGTTAATSYYVSSVSGSIIRIATSVANAFAGNHITTLTNGTVSNYCSVFMTFARPTAGTGSGILGPLLTDSRLVTAVPSSSLNVPFMDFSNGGYYALTGASLGSDLSTLTLTVSPPHNGDIPVGKLISLVVSSGSYAGGNSAVTAIGPHQITAATLVNPTTLLIITATTHLIVSTNSTFLTINEGTYSGGANASGLTGAYTAAPSIAFTATSVAGPPTNQITLTSITGLFVGQPISFANAFGGMSTNVVYYIFSVSGNNIQVSNAPQGGVFAVRVLTTSATGTTGTAGTQGFGVVLTIPTNANTLGLLAVSDGHMRNNVGTTGVYLTQAGTTGSNVVVTTYSPRLSGQAGTLTSLAGFISYGSIPITSAAVTAANTITMRTVVPHGLSSGDSIALNLGQTMTPPFQITIPTSGVTPNRFATQFTNASISGTTLTITFPTNSLTPSDPANPFYTGTPGSYTYVGITPIRVILPYGTRYSDGTDATTLFVSSGTTLTGSNSTTLLVTISATGLVNGAIAFGALPGMIDTNGTASTSSMFNSTQTLAVGTSGNTLVCPFSLSGSISQNIGKFLFMSSITPFALPSLSQSVSIANVYFPVNGRALECPNLNTTFNTSGSTILWSSFLLTPGIIRGPGNTTVIGTATSLNGDAGNTSTDYGLINGYFGSASRFGLRYNNSTGSNSIANISSDTISPFRVNTAYFNLTNSVTSEVGANSVGFSTNGGRFANPYYLNNAIATGGQAATTLTPSQFRIGGNTNATTNYTTYPLSASWYEGGIGDIFVFNRVLSVEERHLLEGYLAHKYRCHNYLGNTSGTTTNATALYNITGGSITGSGPWTHTLTFSAATAFVVGSQVSVAGVTSPSALNGTYVVTASTTTSVSFLSGTVSTARVSGGNVSGITGSSNTYLHPYRISPPTINPSTTLTSTYAIGLAAWFDAANLTSFSFSSGAVISSWSPRGTSISGLSLTQSNATYAPTLVQNAQNGLPGVRFTYVTSPSVIGDFLTSSSYAAESFLTPGYNGDITALIVAKRLQSNTTGYIANFLTSENTVHSMRSNQISSVQSGVFSQTANITSPPDINVPYIYTFSRRQFTCLIRTNGFANGTTTFTLPVRFNGLTMNIVLGGYDNLDSTTGNLYGGDIYEVILFRYAMTDAIINQLEGYLAWKWGLRSSLPTTHPYYRISF